MNVTSSTVLVFLFISMHQGFHGFSACTLCAQEYDPERFEKEVLVSACHDPMQVEALPDGRILFIERGGAVKLCDPVSKNVRTVGNLAVTLKGEVGLLGLAIAHDFQQSQLIYLFYCPVNPQNTLRLSRFQLKSEQLDLTSEEILLEYATEDAALNHQGGGLFMASNGDLILGTGDNTPPIPELQIDERPGQEHWDAQRTSANSMDFRGKILRIHPKAEGGYSIPDGNLFSNSDAGLPEIFAMGVRNGFRQFVDPVTGFIYWGDVGQNIGQPSGVGPQGYDEFNQGRVAGNFGWPYFTGNNEAYRDYDFATKQLGSLFDVKHPQNNSPNNRGMRNLPVPQPALIWYSDTESPEFPMFGSGGRSAMAGPVFRFQAQLNGDLKLPQELDHTFFAYDWMRNWIMSVKLDEDERISHIERFIPSINLRKPIDLKLGADGTLILAESGNLWTGNRDSQISRIVYRRGNRVPQATVKASVNAGRIPLTIRFDGTGSLDRDGDLLQYKWSFGSDGSLGEREGSVTEFTFMQPGVHSIELSVTDPHGSIGRASLEIQAGNAPPQVDLVTPLHGGFYDSEQQLQYRVEVTDEEDARISPERVILEVTSAPRVIEDESTIHPGQKQIRSTTCTACHLTSVRSIGPAFREIADKYRGDTAARDMLVQKIQTGGIGVWGKEFPMPPQPQYTMEQLQEMVTWILGLSDSAEPIARSGFVGSLVAPTFWRDNRSMPRVLKLSANYIDQGIVGHAGVRGEVVNVLHPRRKKATSYDRAEHVKTLDIFEGWDLNILRMFERGWFAFASMNLQQIDRIALRAAPRQTGTTKLEVRLDGVDGPLIAEWRLEASRSDELIFNEYEAMIQPTQGLHDVYFVATNDSPLPPNESNRGVEILDVNWLEFESISTPAIPHVDATASRVLAQSQLEPPLKKSDTIESWADQSLPVKAGLAVWLNAGTSSPRHPSNANNTTEQKGALDPAKQPKRWRDSSGHSSDAIQEIRDAAPVTTYHFPIVSQSFNGRTQFYSFETDSIDLNHCTVIFYGRVHSNLGGSKTFFSIDSASSMNLESGFRLQLGVDRSFDKLTQIVGTGGGLQSETNLLNESIMLGEKSCLITEFTPKSLSLYRGDRLQHSVARATSVSTQPLRWTLGARKILNRQGIEETRGFIEGEVFEFFVYNRILDETERRSMHSYLSTKYVSAIDIAKVASGKAVGNAPLVPVKDPPVIQPLIPGFKVQRLPIELTNINYLQFRSDGALVAGAYNGQVHVLKDTDEDGMLDSSSCFFESDDVNSIMGLALHPEGLPLPKGLHGEGIYIATVGDILLIVDQDRDGKADEVVSVASGWATPWRAAGGVSDALGLAVAKDGRIFFGLGTSDFINPYLLDAATGKPSYRVDSERGTIQVVSSDLSQRTTFCSGIRFPYGLAFNNRDDLFATEQEGATWIANGNPFDELLHIQSGRHYGFPPRHPEYLPHVIDEPSTFDFEPQHQSAVGLCFNEPVTQSARHFGPDGWMHDAFVAGMSRGKLYRTKLAWTPSGYVAKNEIFAQLQKINITQAISPAGSMVVALHSGAPDWGSGPTGMGELWEITPHEVAPPRPVAAWSASPTEFRISFDQPLNANALRRLPGRVQVTQGKYVQAGDRFETMRPGYQVVANQLKAPRYRVDVEELSLADDNRTLVVQTPPLAAAGNYGITVDDSVFNSDQSQPYAGSIDLQTDLNGVQATWLGTDGTGSALWLPHWNTTVSNEFVGASFPHHKFFEQWRQVGRITFQGQLDLHQMLQPVVQEGSRLDWQYPEENIRLRFTAARPFTVALGGANLRSKSFESIWVVEKKIPPQFISNGAWLMVKLDFEAASGEPNLDLTWSVVSSSEDVESSSIKAPRLTQRPFPLRRLLMPYAKKVEHPPSLLNEDTPELAGANWMNGKELFFGAATCSKCHRMRGEGIDIGPDLSNLIFRDYDSVLRDIYDPSAAINPEFVSYSLLLESGIVVTGVIGKEENGTLTVKGVSSELQVSRKDVETMKASTVSMMPSGLDKIFSPHELRDLMAYLLLPPLEPARIVLTDAPPPRSSAEIEDIIGPLRKPAAEQVSKYRPLRVVLCASEKDRAHIKAGYHDYPLWQKRWLRLLNVADGIHAEPADRWPSDEQWQDADLIVFNSYNPAWADESDLNRIHDRGEQLDRFLKRGGGVVFLHFSLNAGPHAPDLARRLGLAWKFPPGKFRHGASAWLLDHSHPLAAGISEFNIPDESYWNLLGNLENIGGRVLANSIEENSEHPQMWTGEIGAGRIFVSVPGHFTWTFDDPIYRLLVFRGMMWSVNQPMDRLLPLTTIGARLEDLPKGQ